MQTTKSISEIFEQKEEKEKQQFQKQKFINPVNYGNVSNDSFYLFAGSSSNPI